MILEEIKTALEDDKTMLFDGLDDCIIGTTVNTDRTFAVYSYNLLVEHFIREDGMEQEDAMEYVDHKFVGVKGEDIPIIIWERAEEVVTDG